MPKVTKVVTIDKNPESIINYIANVKNHPAFISSLKSVKNLNEKPHHEGASWDWTFSMGGVNLEGKGETVKYEKGKVYSFRTITGIDSTFTYAVESTDDGTRLTIDVEYKIPDNVLAKVANKAVVERLNESEGDRAAENLKAILEG